MNEKYLARDYLKLMFEKFIISLFPKMKGNKTYRGEQKN